ncbi:MAG: glycine cleavage system aminomethyltransferase GcvT [Candidatus Polarisedimenticolaceae bacterium]|nr:glycine cleavage system aminomethyltransferase GcvT [Candidatus Polarisedimenticolaceae bacterium]
MTLKTILNDTHRSMGGRMVPFGGWDMPLHYGSQLDEHHYVRRDAGMFDVSHMAVIDLSGENCRVMLQQLLANDVARLKVPGKALYSCMLNEAGGVIDDLIVYLRDGGAYRLVVNAGTAEKDLAWIQPLADTYDVTLTHRSDLAMIAAQGPNARQKCLPLLPASQQQAAEALKLFYADDGEWFIAYTGYTGEPGFEIMLPQEQAVALWQALNEAGIKPCGLGARDTLRLEAGMNLYGQDMDESVSPLEAGLNWTIAWQPESRDFIGRQALESQRERGGLRRFVGIMLTGRGILRSHQKIYMGEELVGETTSGGFAPTLQESVALARVDGNIGECCEVEIRGKRVAAKVVKPPFARNGQRCIK